MPNFLAFKDQKTCLLSKANLALEALLYVKLCDVFGREKRPIQKPDGTPYQVQALVNRH